MSLISDPLVQQGLERNLLSITSDGKKVRYTYQKKSQRLSDPEEQVRVRTLVSLVVEYGYDPKRIDIEVTVPGRIPTIRADIVIYSDEGNKSPFIVVECKREEASEAELQQAVEQGFGYANSLRATYLWLTSGIRNDYFNVAGFPAGERVKNRLADLPKAGKKTAALAKYVKGGMGGFELEVVDESELTRIFKQAHDALWGGGKRNPAEAFDELDKLIFCKVYDERLDRKKGEPYDFQTFATDKDDPNALMNRTRAIYQRGRDKDPEVFKEDIRLSNAELRTVVGYLARVNLHKTELDSKGKAFETFLSGYFRGEFGQFFTPRNIVQLIVDALPISNESLILDTSCGSGGFLLYALAKVRGKADERADEGYYDLNTPEGYQSQRDYWRGFATKNLFGIEISESIARTAKMNMILHDDGHTNVVSHDGLDSVERIREHTHNQGFRGNHFDFIMTNPPFGRKIKLTEQGYLADYALGHKPIDWIDAKINGKKKSTARDAQSSEVLFLEQCHRFLKPGGILAMVIPDSILNGGSMQFVRDWIDEHWRIVSVISMPQHAFAAKGAGVKSSVIILKKYGVKTTARITATKARVQESLFKREEFGPAIKALIQEKDHKLKLGDDIIKKIRLTQHSNAQARIKAHKKSDAYKDWRSKVLEDYNERISMLKETLKDAVLADVNRKLGEYEVLMAIAQDIGYDTTGREIKKNELKRVACETARFIEHVEKEFPHPFF